MSIPMKRPHTCFSFKCFTILVVIGNIALLGCVSPESGAEKAETREERALDRRFDDYPYHTGKLRPTLDDYNRSKAFPHRQVYSRASGWNERTGTIVDVDTYSKENSGEYHFFDRLNIDMKDKVSGWWRPIEANRIFVGVHDTSEKRGSGLFGSGFAMELDTRCMLTRGTGAPSTIEWWERGSLYPTWYPKERRTDPNVWQDVIRATDRRDFTNFEIKRARFSYNKKTPLGEPAGYTSVDMHFTNAVGGLLRASEPKADFGVEKLATNTRRSEAGKNPHTRPAIFNTVVIVFRSGWNQKDRCVVFRMITEFESIPNEPASERRHHWVGFKIFNEGPVVESLRGLKSHVDSKGVPGMADAQSAKALNEITENGGWSVQGFPDSALLPVKFRDNGEPEDLNQELAHSGWHTFRVPEK